MPLTAAPRAQQAVQAHAGFGLANLQRVGRRNRGDAIGQLQRCLEIADRAVVLDAVDRVRRGRQAERGQQRFVELTLEREVVHGRDSRRAPLVVVMQICGRQSGLPIVCMHDIRHEIRRRSLAEISARARQRREAQRIVRPILAVGAGVRIAGAAEQMPGLEHEQIKAGRSRTQNARGAAEVIRILCNNLHIFKRRERRRIPG